MKELTKNILTTIDEMNNKIINDCLQKLEDKDLPDEERAECIHTIKQIRECDARNTKAKVAVAESEGVTKLLEVTLWLTVTGLCFRVLAKRLSRK